MNFRYNGGTAKQQKWVQDAIAQCSYPIGHGVGAAANVTVTWSDTLPPNDTGKLHAYMVTSGIGSGQFLITIASWADDPKNQNNQGLPNPDQDIYDFYKSSFVHEIGHVMSLLTIEASDMISKVCQLFWTADTTDGSARRYGTQNDWDAPSLTWAQEIREAAAEVFKCAFYKGRQIYMNRTSWSIDSAQWAELLSIVNPAMVTTTDWFTKAPDPNVNVLKDGVRVSPDSVGGGELSVSWDNFGSLTVLLFEPFTTGQASSPAGFLPIVVGVQVLSAAGGAPHGLGAWIGTSNLGGVSDQVFGADGIQIGNTLGPVFVPPRYPFWLGVTVDESGNWYQGYWLDGPPTVDSVPDVTVNRNVLVPGDGVPSTPDGSYFPVVAFEVSCGGVGGAIAISDFFFTSRQPGFASGEDYPFGGGDFQVGDGALRGAVLLGH